MRQVTALMSYHSIKGFYTMQRYQKFLLVYLNEQRDEEVEELQAYSYDQAYFFATQQCREENIVSVEQSVCHAI